MKIEYPVDVDRATPEYVLAILNEHHQYSCQVNYDGDLDELFTFDTTVATWRFESDLLPWRQLVEPFNRYWEVNCTEAEWSVVFTPPRKRTLRDVCEFIASRAVRPKVRPSAIMGGSCLPAGIFLTLRSRLRDVGVDVADLRPSTPLDEILRRHPFEVFDAATRLAPGTIEKVTWDAPAEDATLVIFLFGAACLLGQLLTNEPWFTILGVASIAFAYVWSWIAVRRIGPQRVQLDALETFGDLSRAIAQRLTVDHANSTN
jgi:hypothetical protein